MITHEEVKKCRKVGKLNNVKQREKKAQEIQV